MTVGKWRLLFERVYRGGTASGGFLGGLAAMQLPLLWIAWAGLALGAVVQRPRPAAAAAAMLTLAQLCLHPVGPLRLSNHDAALRGGGLSVR